MENIDDNKSIIVTGASGLVGEHFIHALEGLGERRLYALYYKNFCKFKRSKSLKLDITNRSDLLSLRCLRPKLLIHCAAMTGISNCEGDSKRAFQVNVHGTENLVALSKQTGAKLVYLSTDAVFDGEVGGYTEKDRPSPQHHYGKTKLIGEDSCISGNHTALIVRTNLFGEGRRMKRDGFVADLLRSLHEGQIYHAFGDALFSPLYVRTFVHAVLDLLDRKAKGIFHLVGSESLTKYAFAKLIAEIFSFDTSLVRRATIKSLSIARERRLDLSNKKVLAYLERKEMPKVQEMLKEFKNNRGKNG